MTQWISIQYTQKLYQQEEHQEASREQLKVLPLKILKIPLSQTAKVNKTTSYHIVS